MIFSLQVALPRRSKLTSKSKTNYFTDFIVFLLLFLLLWLRELYWQLTLAYSSERVLSLRSDIKKNQRRKSDIELKLRQSWRGKDKG